MPTKHTGPAEVMSEALALEYLRHNIHQDVPVLEDGSADLNKTPVFDAVLHSLKNLKADPGLLTCEFVVPAHLCNRRETLHGGAIGNLLLLVQNGYKAVQCRASSLL